MWQINRRTISVVKMFYLSNRNGTNTQNRKQTTQGISLKICFHWFISICLNEMKSCIFFSISYNHTYRVGGMPYKIGKKRYKTFHKRLTLWYMYSNLSILNFVEFPTGPLLYLSLQHQNDGKLLRDLKSVMISM